MHRLPCALLLTLSVAVLAAGCGGDGKKAEPAKVKVGGKIKLDGKPMEGGEVRFTAEGQPPQVLEIKTGVFSGEVHSGMNLIEVVLEKDMPHPMDPKMKMKVNMISERFWGPGSTLKADLKDAKDDFDFSVTSKK